MTVTKSSLWPEDGDDNWLLAHDAITEFLADMVDLDPLKNYQSPSSDDLMRSQQTYRGEKVAPRASRKARVMHRERVTSLQSEIEELHQHLKRLYEHRDQSISRPSPCTEDRTNWKRRAATERLMTEQVEYENQQLKKHATANQQFADQVRYLLEKQSQAMPSRPRISITLKSDGSQIYGMLSASMDAQYHQLAASMHIRLQELKKRCISPDDKSAMMWALQYQQIRLGMNMEALGIMPFTAAEFASVVSKYGHLDKIQSPNEDIVEKVDQRMNLEAVGTISADNPAGSSEVEARSITRRIVTAHGTLFMWESMSYWQTHNSLGKPKRAMVRESGWSIVSPLCEAGFENANISYCKSSVNIYSVDGLRMKKSNALAKGIMSTLQKLFDIQSRNVENLVMDVQVRRQKQQQQQLEMPSIGRIE